MIINTEDPIYDFSDFAAAESFTGLMADVDLKDQEDVLSAVNMLPRIIGACAKLLEQVEEAAAEFLEATPEFNLEDRTDDWLADKRKEIEKSISILKREQEQLTAEKKDIEDEFFRRFSERNSQGTTTANWALSAKIDDAYPTVGDREVFEEYMLKTGKLHLLQKRLAVTAIREELDLMAAEKAHWLEELEENQWDTETCERALRWMHEEEQDQYNMSEEERITSDAAFDNKMLVVKQLGQLSQVAKETIENHYKVPGIDLEQKLTLYQRKRNS
jgi:hypothetical protein